MNEQKIGFRSYSTGDAAGILVIGLCLGLLAGFIIGGLVEVHLTDVPIEPVAKASSPSPTPRQPLDCWTEVELRAKAKGFDDMRRCMWHGPNEEGVFGRENWNCVGRVLGEVGHKLVDSGMEGCS